MLPDPNSPGVASRLWRPVGGARKVPLSGPAPGPPMSLHLPTLFLLNVYVLTLLGCLMLHVWWRSDGESTLGCSAGTLLLAGLGVLVVGLRGRGMDTLSIMLGHMLLQLASGLGWATMRVFVGRRLWWPGIAGGALLWALLCQWPYFMSTVSLRLTVATLLTILYTLLAAGELWGARRLLEVAIGPVLALLLVHALFCSGLLLLSGRHDIDWIWGGLDDGFLTWRLLEAFLFVIGMAFATLAMVRERAELRYRAVAYRDPLTDIGNRRAFTVGSEALLVRCAAEGRPATLLLCDLDHFKRLNDTHGHAMGDAALIAFGRLLALGIRQQDICGRIGGEEFACLLPGADERAALQVAERIRHACSELLLGTEVRVSVSIGIASTAQAGYELSRLLALGDQALYRAKAKGRNRVECFAD
ncbi:GGDEF domain-containing protein [Azotobacter chroococcum]|uniref:diguanylate cyclase n=2 Tax=Azotobacter chroococcum TaxID=353 RepID=A0AA43Z5H2_9GAMM|nr:GGDEF domain-containing protein [Azotobacter chroococcum]